jgi:hypothetical protein
LSTVRLTVDLRRREVQLTELNTALTASSDRLRAARVEQQQRMRAQVDQRVTPHLRAAIACLQEGGQPDVSRVRQEAGRALDELRMLARGLHPPRLLEDGLIAALDGWMEQRARPVMITGIPADGLAEAELRVAYFCAVTLLDALADADAQQLELTVGDDGRLLELCIRGRPPQSSVPDHTTVQLARDRLEAFDGTLTSSWSHDTVTFTARLPRAAGLPRP